MEKIIDLYIDRAMERNDYSRALAYKWIKTTEMANSVDVTDELQQIHYRADK